MSNSIQASGELLTASVDDRTLTYRLLPFNEPGHTNQGTIVASEGSLEIPADLNTLELNEEHNFQNQIGKFVRVEETENGIEATVRIVNTSRGNDALVLAAEGLRTGISVEIAEPVIRAGKLIKGRLTGAGLVVRPAFSNARLTAADCGETHSTKETKMENISENVEAIEASAPVQAAPIFASDSKVNLSKITFEAAKSGHSVQAALADLLTTDDAGKAYIKDQEVGELWEARKTERPLINAVGVKNLDGLVVTGHKKNRTFAVADWAGNKVELPTGKFTNSRETWVATKKAVAVDIAAELLYFGGEGVVADAYEQAMDSYIEQSEAELLTYLLENGTELTDLLTPLETINRASALLGSIGARMDFVVCSPAVYAELQSIKAADAPWWLASQSSVDLRNQSANVGGVTITSNPALLGNRITVGDSRAVDYRETPELRFRALDVAHGGVDISFIKMKAQKITDPGAILNFDSVVVAP